MDRPTSGSRTIKSLLEAKGHTAARSRVARLMRLMGLRAIYPKRRTSSPGTGHKIYPYLLKTMKIDKPGQVYAADITYIPMAKGFLYLAAVIDWHSRKALAHRLSNTLDAGFCVEAAEEAIVRYGTVSEARKSVADYLRYFNEEQPRQGLDNRIPDDVFYRRKPLTKAA